MNLLKDLWAHLKEWSDWKLKDWIKAGILVSRFRHPARQAQALATSGAGIVHREMMDLQRQPELNKADTGRLKELRRDWNRNRKYTDAGMSIAGASTPQGAMKYYMDTTEDFRQLNKPSYNKMYPLTGGFMDYADKGGIWGAILSGFAGKTRKNIMDYGKDILEKKGILGAVDPEEATPEILQNYAEKTFGPNMYDVAGPWFGTAPIEDVEISDLPWQEDKIIEPSDVSSDIIESDLSIDPKPEPNILDPDYLTWDALYGDEYTPEGIPKNEPRIIPGISTPTPLQEENLDVDLQLPYTQPFDDSGREYGIMLNQGLVTDPMEELRNRTLQDEYINYIESTGDRLTYEEFERAWERMHALPRGLHFQEPRAGLR